MSLRIGKRLRAALAALMAQPAEVPPSESERFMLLGLRDRQKELPVSAEDVAVALMNGVAGKRRFKTEDAAKSFADDLVDKYPNVSVYATILRGQQEIKPYYVVFSRHVQETYGSAKP